MKTFYDFNPVCRHDPGEWCPRRAFDLYTLCCFQTPFLYEIDGAMKPGDAGDLLLMEPGRTVYHGPRPEAEEGYLNGYIRLGPAEEVTAWLAKYPLPLNTAFSVGQDNFLLPYAEAVKREERLSEPGHDDKMHSILLGMLIDLYRAYFRTVTPDNLKRLQDIHNAVWGSPEKDWNLNDMARQGGYSVSRFSVLYREEYGCSPVRDVLNARMKKAGDLLFYGAMTVSEAALGCGFRNVYHFSKLFKKMTGLTPSQYVKSRRGEN